MRWSGAKWVPGGPSLHQKLILSGTGYETGGGEGKGTGKGKSEREREREAKEQVGEERTNSLDPLKNEGQRWHNVCSKFSASSEIAYTSSLPDS